MIRALDQDTVTKQLDTAIKVVLYNTSTSDGVCGTRSF